MVGRTTTDANVESQHWFVSPDYFATLRVPLLRGRLLSDADGKSPVILINETFARRYFPAQDPVGQRLTFDKATIPGMTEFTIVGVVGDVRDRSLIEPARIAVIHPANGLSGSYLLLRTDGDPAALVAPLRAILRDMDPRLALSTPRFLEEMRAQSMARQRFFAMVLGIFAVVGLVLATVGVYGVLAQLARGRAREMGIRVALGAPLASVRWLVVGHGLRLAVVGLADRRRRGAVRDARAHVAAIRRRPSRSAGVRRRRRDSHGGERGGIVDSRAAHDARESGNGAARRVVVSDRAGDRRKCRSRRPADRLLARPETRTSDRRD